MQLEQQQFIYEFAEHVEDRLITLEQGLLNLQTAEDSDLYQLIGILNSVQEGAQMLGLSSIETTAYNLQNNLRLLRSHPIKVDQKLESLFLQGFDALCLLVKQLEDPFGISDNTVNQSVLGIEPVFQALKTYLDYLINPYVPFAEIEQVFPLESAVKNAAAEYGKQADVMIEGRDILIPESLLKHLPKLFSHLINNAIAHGIELPDVRQQAGKSPVGQIVLRAFSQGNQIAIAFSDDGAGIDVERVKAKALEKRLISTSQARTLSAQEVYELLYHPDFTTKDERDLRAGTGFGLNIVRTELNKIGGVISTDSIPGKGTTFTILYRF